MNTNFDQRKLNFLMKLSLIPRNITQYGDRYNVIEFILHELCHEECLNMEKAAYFIDNHDFDCLHGIAGVDLSQKFDSVDIWQVPDAFSQYMSELHFNKKVKDVKTFSSKNKDQGCPGSVQELADHLGMFDVSYAVIPLRHDNHGVLVYETKDHEFIKTYDLLHGLSILALCPLF